VTVPADRAVSADRAAELPAELPAEPAAGRIAERTAGPAVEHVERKAPAPVRRSRNAEKRMSRRPSRLGALAGVAPRPDYTVEPDAGFTGLLRRVWQRAAAADDLAGAVDILLSLDGHVPPDVQLRAVDLEAEVALKVLTGVGWREDDRPAGPAAPPGGPSAFLGEIGLSTSGRVVVRVPSQRPLAGVEELVDGVIRVPWSAQALRAYQAGKAAADLRFAVSLEDCRRWLDDAGPAERDELLGLLGQAALRTAPFVLYHQRKQYTNFRDRNTLTGKTLWPGHPDCALSALRGIPLDLWSDDDVMMVVCLTLLVRSAGFARIEEANGTQLTVGHVAHLLEQTRRRYNEVPGRPHIPPAASQRVEAVNVLAEALRARRPQLAGDVQLYREIHGALMHKIERVAAPFADAGTRREAALCAHLRDRLPVTGRTLGELATSLAASPQWLARPTGAFGSGLEALVYETVSGANLAFEADFTMSRGMRSLPRLIDALRRQDWPQIIDWDITNYFCCVVPAPRAAGLFGDSVAHVADTSWAISSRMQYNSWHFIAGNLPDGPEVEARDYFVPPTLPDIAFYSDQHHHGHVASKVRFSIRSPQAVQVLDRTFNGFVDLRLLRCAGEPFDEQDLLAAHRVAAFVARATALVAELVAAGTDVEVTAFDSQWHWTQLAELS
jgi:hypothetical protein